MIGLKYRKELLKEIQEFLEKQKTPSKVKFVKTYNVQGRCFFNKKMIYISYPTYAYNDKKGREALLMHEILHFTVRGHGRNFNKAMKDAGYSDKDIRRIGRYVLVCPKCRNIVFINSIKKEWKLSCKICSTKDNMQPVILYKDTMR